MNEIPAGLWRVPHTVYASLGVMVERASQCGMVGCGLQYDHTYTDILWNETTITLSALKEEVLLFVNVKGIPYTYVPDQVRDIRLSILDAREYLRRYDSLNKLTEAHRRNKFLRLGRRSLLPLWELSPREVCLIGMPDSEFNRCYVTDPMGPLSHSEVVRRITRLSPVCKVDEAPPELLPGRGSWKLGISAVESSTSPR